MIQKVFILGASGSVWRELIKQILEKDYGSLNPSIIVWVANSNSYIFDENGIDKSFLENISLSREWAIEIFNNTWEKINKLVDLVSLVKYKNIDSDVVFADVTAWKDELLEMHLEILNNSKSSLSTANKNPISLYWIDEFNKLNSSFNRYDTNTTVMWGGWVLNFVKERFHIWDNIGNIVWVFSWTLWYICSELEKNELSFSEIVKNAKEGGYTEPNPWDDLNWLDVARKVVILARYSWMDVSINDVEVNPLVSEKYAKLTWEEFLNALKEEDEKFRNLVLEASKNWKTLRYVWEINNWKLSVWLKQVDKNSDLGWLSGTANLAIVETEIMEEPIPHLIKSRWAWLALTAASVRIWIKKML